MGDSKQRDPLPELRRRVSTVAVLAAILALVFGPSSCQGSSVQFAGKVETVSIGIPPNEQSALTLIAEDQKLFAANGLNATVKTYETALAAINGMKKGEVDVAQSAEYPIVAEAFKKEQITVLGSVDRHQTVFLVGRKDLGIENPSDLKGKKIGVPRGTVTEFYLGRFLTLNGMNLADVTIVNLPFTQAAEALTVGTVAAFQVRNRDIRAITERLGDTVVIWPSQSGQAAYEVISGKRDWVDSHPETISRLLKSIAAAEEYAVNHPAEVMAIIRKKLNYDDAYMATIGPQHQYSLTLDQSLILAMEDQARWAISNNLTSEKAVPDFLDYMYIDGLKAVKPEAVNIIR